MQTDINFGFITQTTGYYSSCNDTIATVSMFLSCKMEETPRLLLDVVVVAYEIMYRTKPVAAERIKQKV
ncbi:hypothetical protein MKX03_017392, partial [Papaver bracteatum]